jgi:CRP-like cAMP-binding protein
MHVLIRKLQALHSLSEEEQTALLAAISETPVVERGQDIASDGSMPNHSTVILSGVACRYKMLKGGRRQILCFQFPGDVVDIYSYVLKRLDHGISALTRCEVAHIPHPAIRKLCETYPNLAYTLWRDSLVDTAILHMNIVNAGRRNAPERIAHLICEQYMRLKAVGLAELDKPVKFYITQTDIADATGLSLVHVNKTLKSLKAQNLIGRDPQIMEILNWAGLKKAAGFDPGYLHFKNIDE